MNSAGRHFETAIANHIATESDLGDIGHSRKLFPDILKACEIWLDKEVVKFLCNPLKSTGLPPHYYVSADKATLNRITNQAIVIVTMVEGCRKAILVKAPEVYSSGSGDGDNAVDEEISGSRAEELAKGIVECIKDQYCVEVLQGWQGTSCDGPYQAKDFENSLNTTLGRTDDTFDVVIWDPPHWVDLAMKDVKDGKICDNASSYLNRIIKRTTKLHTKFNRGKMLQQVKSVANHNAYAEDVKFKVLSRTCGTRFSTSQYSEFLKLTESLPLYIDTFRKYGFNQDDEYEVAGKDFVVDLLALTDLMHPMIDLLVTLQGLSIPSWKICLWWPKVKRRIQKCIPISFESPDLPLTSTHIRDIRKGKFKGTKVVPGWLKVEKNVSEDASDGKKTTTIKWRARDLKDCRLDLEVFCGAMIKSMDDRFSGKSVKPMQKQLTAVDLDELVSLCCGHKNGTSVVIDEVQFEEYGKEEFLSSWAYICRLPHIKSLDGLFKGELSHIVHRNIKQTLKSIIWEKKFREIMMQWFTVLPDGQNDGIANDPLCKFSILDDAEASACLDLSRNFLPLQNIYRMEFEDGNYWCLTIVKNHLLTLFLLVLELI